MMALITSAEFSISFTISSPLFFVIDRLSLISFLLLYEMQRFWMQSTGCIQQSRQLSERSLLMYSSRSKMLIG